MPSNEDIFQCVRLSSNMGTKSAFGASAPVHPPTRPLRHGILMGGRVGA